MEATDIKEVIDYLGLTQEEFALQLDKSLRTVSYYIAGKVDPPAKVKRKIEEMIAQKYSNTPTPSAGDKGRKEREVNDYISVNGANFEMEKFLDIFFLNEERIVNHPRFKYFIKSIKQEGIIDYIEKRKELQSKNTNLK